MDAAVLAHQSHAIVTPPPDTVDKWQVLRDLATAREAYGLSDRDMTVLQALLSFRPGADLANGDAAAGLVVYPSNRTLCERLNGMPCSTMRRHVARLVQAGILLRRDSPNGKRYARRYGGEQVAYGFDLSPLLARCAEFHDAAESARNAAERLRHQRETVSLMRRDLANLSEYAASLSDDPTLWDRFTDLARLTARTLRRRLNCDDLTALESTLSAALTEIRNILEPSKSEKMSINDAPDEQHHQRSNKELDKSVSDKALKPIRREQPDEIAEEDEESHKTHKPVQTRDGTPKVPLSMVLSACTEIQTYSDRPIRSWKDLVHACETVRPMMGIPVSAWTEASEAMGPVEAAIVIGSMLERFVEIRSPGGYLRHLSSKAALGKFSSSSMVMALLRKEAA